MLALEILKKIYANNPDTRSQRNNIDINFTIHDFSNVNEAIKELETLENRSCNSCKYSYDIFESFKKEEDKNQDFICTLLKVDKVFKKDFYCSGWESK